MRSVTVDWSCLPFPSPHSLYSMNPQCNWTQLEFSKLSKFNIPNTSHVIYTSCHLYMHWLQKLSYSLKVTCTKLSCMHYSTSLSQLLNTALLSELHSSSANSRIIFKLTYIQTTHSLSAFLSAYVGAVLYPQHCSQPQSTINVSLIFLSKSTILHWI